MLLWKGPFDQCFEHTICFITPFITQYKFYNFFWRKMFLSHLADSKFWDVHPHLPRWGIWTIPLSYRISLIFLCLCSLNNNKYFFLNIYSSYQQNRSVLCNSICTFVLLMGCLTLWCKNLQHCWFRTSTNSDSKSWSLYQAPPVTVRSGSTLYNIYTFFLDAYKMNIFK